MIQMMNEEFGVKTYIGSTQGEYSGGNQMSVPDEDRLSKTVCRQKGMQEDKCELCDSGELEDVGHFPVLCEEFQWKRQELL